jgi:DNA polymerase V
MVETRRDMEEAVASYTARAAEKLRRQHLAATRLTVFVMTNRFREQDTQYSGEQSVRLPVATADTGKLVAAAMRGLAAIWREGFRYKKAGVMLLELCPAAEVQGGLFDPPDDDRVKARMAVLDTLTAAMEGIHHLRRRRHRSRVEDAARDSFTALYNMLERITECE